MGLTGISCILIKISSYGMNNLVIMQNLCYYFLDHNLKKQSLTSIVQGALEDFWIMRSRMDLKRSTYAVLSVP